MFSAKAPSVRDVPAEVHLQRGIELHEEGDLQKSTYHLRLAAKAGHPTAMLLYALACRHGWGMKPNAAEGVTWLQRAVDSAQLEVAEDEDLVRHGHGVDVGERKTHKAQFALSVYELGVSYMKGWGVGQDRALGLRCFEIAGNWGDGDALAEAGYCYLEGIGCKKDLKKSAKFYRLAELKGVQVAGNSWYVFMLCP
jgi:TPR repeat protein